MARPTKLTPALQDAIVRAVTGGVPYVQACLLADVKKSAAHQWRERGEGRHVDRPPTPLYVQFVEAIEKAEATDEANRILRLERAGRGGQVVSEKTTTFPDGRILREVQYTRPEWTADAWWLERRWPDRYGRRLQVDLRAQIQAAVEKVAAEMGIEPETLLAEAQAFVRELR